VLRHPVKTGSQQAAGFAFLGKFPLT